MLAGPNINHRIKFHEIIAAVFRRIQVEPPEIGLCRTLFKQVLLFVDMHFSVDYHELFADVSDSLNQSTVHFISHFGQLRDRDGRDLFHLWNCTKKYDVAVPVAKRKRTPHWLMRTATESYLKREEQFEAGKDEDMARYEACVLTGNAVEQEKVELWLNDLTSDKQKNGQYKAASGSA